MIVGEHYDKVNVIAKGLVSGVPAVEVGVAKSFRHE